MKRWTKLFLIVALLILIAFMTLPLWGMGPAVFLDSERTVISRTISPDGRRVAQVERIIVGGVPSIVIVVRSPWMPDWYLSGCAAASHYENSSARVRWISKNVLEIRPKGDPRDWETGSAPFHRNACKGLKVVVT